ncbi:MULTISPECIES: TetR/AcrR family transcriptional regulator [Acetobacterium]|uniref:TetR/AcrR family transcriptional regulator n=1 Tax=Acetobacterium TaxID=33951 RepID=UPI000B9CAA66|nr:MULTISPECIES: TetR/AcrR family transcriptional regulator [Acetobacterium]MEA4804329.1 TetR/AcrR family transcriptional regulator [Acetobacterium wieringae]OXS27052.1 MAG: TetR family transcriptional regulator [Acetobacterium sp. MES1]
MEKEISRRDRKKRQVLTTLVDVTMKLFIEKGFAETTIAEIASAADIGTGTFYNYFHSKEDVLRYVLTKNLDETKDSLEELNRSSMSPPEKISQILLTIGKIFKENQQLFNLCNRHLSLMGPPHGTEFKDILVAIIQEGRINGDFRNDVPIEMITELFMGLIKSALTSHAKISFEENLNYKLKLFMNGLLTK